MTQPTQAQIEAALIAFYGTTDVDKIERDGITLAVTAAAQVGKDERDTFTATAWLDAEKKLETIKAATIERCAQVAEEFWSARPDIGKQVAAAIRALATEGKYEQNDP